MLKYLQMSPYLSDNKIISGTCQLILTHKRNYIWVLYQLLFHFKQNKIVWTKMEEPGNLRKGNGFTQKPLLVFLGNKGFKTYISPQWQWSWVWTMKQGADIKIQCENWKGSIFLHKITMQENLQIMQFCKWYIKQYLVIHRKYSISNIIKTIFEKLLMNLYHIRKI